MIITPKFRTTLAIFAISIVPVALARPPQTPPAPKPERADEKYPSSLAREIHHQLLVLPFYSVFDHIDFSLKGSTVVLNGQVLRPTLKKHAEAAVRSIEGVAVVVNQIELLPASPSDDDLRTAIYRVIFEDPTLARYGIPNVPAIHIVVKNGNVRLEGTVESGSDKDLAASRASAVPKVQSVKNNLVVQPSESAAE
jgi:hyperosmotically inducible periplasmic protein